MPPPGRAAAAALLSLVCAAPGWAGSPADRRCQQAIAGASAQILGRSMAILASCQRALVRGKLPADTVCLADPATSRRRTAASVRPTRRIRQACSDAQIAALALAGDCAGVGTVDDLLACLQASHETGAALLVAAASVAHGPLPAAKAACATRASGATRSFALARLHLIQACKRSRRRDQLMPGTDCSSEPRTARRIATLRTRAAGKIAAACDAAALAAAPFAPPCGALATGADLAQCLLATADGTGNGALAAEYPDPGFCGDAADVVEGRIDGLLAQMTLADKVDQMNGVSLTGIAHTAANAALGVPGLAMIDGPRGVGITAGKATAFPVGAARGATWDPALEERVGEAMGAEARAKGASVLLAPTMNLLRHPRWGRAQETYGEDTLHLGRMAVGFIRGAQQHVIASAKHFAGNSIEDTRFSVDVSIDERTLREIYLPHFRMAVQDGHSGSVMSAYNQVNGHYCGENAHLLHDVLKEDWGFRGFVESDWVVGTHDTVASATAGLDIEMPIPRFYGPPLVDAVMAGTVPESTVDAAVRRILRAQLCFRLDSDPPQVDPAQVETPAHADLALQVAREGIVLLKNDGATLPLDRTHTGSIVVVGGLAERANLGDFGSSSVNPSHAVAPLDGIRAGAGSVTVTYIPSTTLSPDDEVAVAAADAAVVVAGLTYADEGEGFIAAGDRKSLVLPGDQDALVAAVAALNPRTVVVLEGSGAMVLPWVDQVEGILMAWYPGQEGGTAIADVLFGDVTPSGKLPVSFPHAEQDLPPFDNLSLAVTYDYFHGYRYLDRNGVAPLFPFGFGLSYTTFQYTNLTVFPATLSRYGRLRVSADVTNTGVRPGDEVAQLYVGAQGSRVDRAVHDLKGFARVHLAPGEKKTVSFELRAGDLAFWDVAAAGWELEPLTYLVGVGPSSRDLPLGGSFAVAP